MASVRVMWEVRGCEEGVFFSVSVSPASFDSVRLCVSACISVCWHLHILMDGVGEETTTRIFLGGGSDVDEGCHSYYKKCS